MLCKALSVHSVKISSAGVVECLLFHNGVTHASVWGELLLLLGGALTSRGWHSFREHPTNSSEHVINGSAQSKLLQLAGPQFPVQLSCCEKTENSKRHVRRKKDKTKKWISALSTRTRRQALLHHIKYKKVEFGRINKSVSRSIRQSTYHNWRRLVAVLVVAHIRV